jgi:hypothetical protein
MAEMVFLGAAGGLELEGLFIFLKLFSMGLLPL